MPLLEVWFLLCMPQNVNCSQRSRISCTSLKKGVDSACLGDWYRCCPCCETKCFNARDMALIYKQFKWQEIWASPCAVGRVDIENLTPTHEKDIHQERLAMGKWPENRKNPALEPGMKWNLGCIYILYEDEDQREELNIGRHCPKIEPVKLIVFWPNLYVKVCIL